MTCIVGLQADGSVIIGGDSASVEEGTLAIRTSSLSKVFMNKEYLFGFAGLWRMGQLLQFALDPPRTTNVTREKLDKFMATTFIDSVRECLREGGFTKTEVDRESGGNFLVGARGRLYEIGEDYSIARTADGYEAIGCGREYALGSLHASVEWDDPSKRISYALETAAKFSGGVTPPFTVLKLSGK